MVLRRPGRILIDGESHETYTIQNDYYYVLGDNFYNSFDSRYWGFVSDRDLIGEVLVIYWSWTQGSSSETLSAISSIRWERIGSLVR
ncbi:MAG: S26 family signal peptidase [Proteobacteria bacterium]|nr:S26 family signal peptidase [Pseudomonadota bacterium]